MSSQNGSVARSLGGDGTVHLAVPTELRVISQTPDAPVTYPVDHLSLSFSAVVAPESFTAQDVELLTPLGPVPAADIAVSLYSPLTYSLAFPVQTAPGDYQLKIGPNIQDLTGAPMSQVYTGAFTISLPVVQGSVADTNGIALPAVQMRVTGSGSAYSTDANGTYAVGAPLGTVFTITPLKPGWLFVPSSRAFTNINANVSGEDFLAVTSIVPSVVSGIWGSNLLVRCMGIPGVSYQLNASSNLVDWVPVGGWAVGTNGPLGWYVPTTDPAAVLPRAGAQLTWGRFRFRPQVAFWRDIPGRCAPAKQSRDPIEPGLSGADSSAQEERISMSGPDKTSRNEERLALALGWFSLGLGVAELFAPRHLSRFIGVRTNPRFVQALGLREVATGLAILAQPRRSTWLKARAAGDAIDLALLGSAFGKTNAASRLATATAAVTGVTLLDVFSSRRLNRSDGAVESKRSISIGRPPQELYALWRNFEQLPRFMTHLISVRVNDNTHSHWVAKGPAGARVEWDAELTEDKPNELIAWHTVGEAGPKHEGVVRFETARGNRGTVVRVAMRYWPPLGKASSKVARLLGQDPEKQLRIDLMRFKQLMEAGEIARTEGQPAGRGRSTSRVFDDLVRA